MSRPRFLVLAPVLIIALLATASSQSRPSRKPQPQHTVSHASWTPILESGFGISEHDFRDMGLGALTEDQEWSLLAWVNTREKQAKDSVVTPIFTCGRPGEIQDTKPESYDKVRVFVHASGDADEVISGVRERLRAMNGTEVVYSSDEADLTVSLVAIQTKSKGAGYQLGTAISVVVSKPCVWKFGTYTDRIDTVRDQFVQVGSEISGVVASIVSSIDTDTLENQRQANATLKKILQDQKKYSANVDGKGQH